MNRSLIEKPVFLVKHLPAKLLFAVWLIFSFGDLRAAPSRSFDSLAAFIDKYHLSEGTACREKIQEMYEIAKESPDSLRLFSQCFYKEATLRYSQGFADSTLIPRIKKRMSAINTHSNPSEYALLSLSLGLCLDAEGNYSEGFINASAALENFKKLRDTTYLMKTLNLLGNICSHVRLLNMADDYYRQALQLNCADPEYYRVKANFYRLLYSGGDTWGAIDSLKLFLYEVERQKDSGALAIVNLNLGVFYFALNDFDSTFYYTKIAENILNDIDNQRLNSVMEHNFGLYYFFKEHDYKTALKYFSIVKESALRQENFEQLSSIYYVTSHTFASLGQYDSAFYYAQRYQELSLRLINNPKTIEAYQAYISNFLETSENKLTIAQQEIELKNRQFLFVIILAVAIVLLTLLLLIVAQQKKRLQNNKNKELAKQLEHEKKIQQLQQEKQNEIIEAKTREITSYSLQLSNKNNVLKEILEVSKELPKDAKEVEKKIHNIVQKNINIDNDWKNFKISFDKVHPSFFEKLKSCCPELTEENLRMCAYFKIGMANKQIAQILNVAPNSIIVHRYRLKKKLGLSEEESLDDFIRSL